jgi:SAM-dependent methyltransferase
MIDSDGGKTKLKHQINDFKKLWRFSIGFYGVWIAHIGREMKLFESISGFPKTINELSIATGNYSPAVRAWCSAALSYGFISEKNGKLQLRKGMREMLVDRTNPNYLGGQFSYLALRSLEYGSFKRLFKLGKTNNLSTLSLNAIGEATEWDHFAFLSAIRRSRDLQGVLSKRGSLLDVGCGAGNLLTKILERYPNANLVGIDPSQIAVGRALKLIKGKPISIMRQRAESMGFVNEFDIVFLGEVLYEAIDKTKVISNCWQALKENGTIAILEGFLPGSSVVRGNDQLIRGMQIDFALFGHKFMTKREVRTLLYNKFSRIRFKDLGGQVYLVTAKKS